MVIWKTNKSTHDFSPVKNNTLKLNFNLERNSTSWNLAEKEINNMIPWK